MRYSTVRIEVLPNLRHAGIFQISTIQKPLTRPGVELDEKMSICSSTPSTSSLRLLRRWLDLLPCSSVVGYVYE